MNVENTKIESKPCRSEHCPVLKIVGEKLFYSAYPDVETFPIKRCLYYRQNDECGYDPKPYPGISIPKGGRQFDTKYFKGKLICWQCNSEKDEGCEASPPDSSEKVILCFKCWQTHPKYQDWNIIAIWENIKSAMRIRTTDISRIQFGMLDFIHKEIPILAIHSYNVLKAIKSVKNELNRLERESIILEKFIARFEGEKRKNLSIEASKFLKEVSSYLNKFQEKIAILNPADEHCDENILQEIPKHDINAVLEK